MTTPLVSIIIPCFNAERLISEAIESALGQTWPNCEVIVIDDGSTDSSVSVIRAFGDRVRWESGPNRGGNAARNRGVQLACGQFVQFLDADDVLCPDKLSRMVPLALDAGEHVLVACGWELVAEDGQTVTHHALDYEGPDPFIWCLNHDLQTSSPLHWKSNLISAGGFDESLPRCQEFDLHLRLFRSGLRLKAMSESLYRFRRQPGSVSSCYSRVLCTRLMIHERLLKDLWEENPGNDGRRKALAQMLARDGRHLVRTGFLEEASRSFSLALEADGTSIDRAFGCALTRWLARRAGPVFSEQVVQAIGALPWGRRRASRGQMRP